MRKRNKLLRRKFLLADNDEVKLSETLREMEEMAKRKLFTVEQLQCKNLLTKSAAPIRDLYSLGRVSNENIINVCCFSCYFLCTVPLCRKQYESFKNRPSTSVVGTTITIQTNTPMAPQFQNKKITK